ncbi:hypothetical protein C8039_19390 [Halogeometricum sp. wsp3]|nr:hypothetical protein C8039_19390 [Halogeometricum sp. wsp3]
MRGVDGLGQSISRRNPSPTRMRTSRCWSSKDAISRPAGSDADLRSLTASFDTTSETTRTSSGGGHSPTSRPDMPFRGVDSANSREVGADDDPDETGREVLDSRQHHELPPRCRYSSNAQSPKRLPCTPTRQSRRPSTASTRSLLQRFSARPY